jgi:hypothetical protein
MLPVVANTTTAAVARIRAWAVTNNWSKSRYAKEAGLVDTTLRHFHDPSWNPTLQILEKLEAVIPRDWEPDPAGLGDDIPATPGESDEPSLVEPSLAGIDAVVARRQAASHATGDPAPPSHPREAARQHDETAPRDFRGRGR